MAKDKQKIVIKSTCFYKGDVLEAGAGYEMAIADVRELRGAGRVAQILKDEDKLPAKTADKKGAAK
jgi:archaellum component FlaC